LKNVAGAFKGTSDPYAVVTLLASDPNEQPKVLGKTEVIKNSLNPKWTTSFDLPYELGTATRINVGIYDEMKKGTHKPMGSAMFEVGEVLGSRGNIKAKNLRNGGTLYARITPAPDPAVPGAGGTLHLKLSGVKLANVDSGLFSKTDPFFEILSKVDSAGGLSWQPVYRSKHIMNNLNPEWEPLSIDLSRLCGGDLSRPVQFKLYDWQKNGKHTAIGTFETTVGGFLDAQVSNPADTSKAFTVLRRGKLIAGKIVVLDARVESGSVPSSVPAASTTAASSVEGTSMAPEAFSAQSAVDSDPFSSALTGLTPSYSATPSSAALSASTPITHSAPLYDLGSMSNLPPAIAPPALHSSMPAGPFVPPAYASGPPAASSANSRRPKFVEYLSGGMELELCIAIDFTGSNGDPRRPGTLHYIHPDGSLNDYEKAITAVGSIISKYDNDQVRARCADFIGESFCIPLVY
jgi:C2 domain/Copine